MENRGKKKLVNNPITKHMERIINQHKEILYYFLNKKYWIDVQTWNEYEIKLNENSRAHTHTHYTHMHTRHTHIYTYDINTTHIYIPYMHTTYTHIQHTYNTHKHTPHTHTPVHVHTQSHTSQQQKSKMSSSNFEQFVCAEWGIGDTKECKDKYCLCKFTVKQGAQQVS